MNIIGTSFKRTWASNVLFRACHPTWSYSQPMLLPDFPRHSQTSLAQSLLWTLLLTPGSWSAQILSVPSNSVFQSCGSSIIKFHWLQKLNFLSLLSLFAGSPGSESCSGHKTPLIVPAFLSNNYPAICALLGDFMVGWKVTSSKIAYATNCITQICSSQSLSFLSGLCWPMPLQETFNHSKVGLSLWDLWVYVHRIFYLSILSMACRNWL